MSFDKTAHLRALAQRLLALPETPLRLALRLLSMAEERDGRPIVETTGEMLAADVGLPRTSLRRAIDTLVNAGFCVVKATEGRGGKMAITISDLGQFVNEHNQYIMTTILESPDSKRPVNSCETGQFQVSETMRESLADLGDRGELAPEKLASLGHIVADPRARDLDLQRSSGDPDLGSDRRSPTSQDLTSIVPAQSDDTGPLERSPRKRPPRKRSDAAQIPERAWAAADYLRHKVIEQVPSAVARNGAWDVGWNWGAGSEKGTRVGDGSRVGKRLSWANSFRILHQAVLKANQAVDHTASEDSAWREIAATVKWVFHGQTGAHQLEVESPDTLYSKWDRIKRARMRDGRSPERAGPKRADGRPDPMAGRTLTQWKLGDA